MRWLSDNVLAKLQSGLGAPMDGDPETEIDLHLKGQVFGDRFAIDQWLGSGGMGTVYRAVDQETGELAVVKLIHPSFVGRDGKGAALAVLKEATALEPRGDGTADVYYGMADSRIGVARLWLGEGSLPPTS